VHQKLAIFQQALEISAGIPTNSCRRPTQEIMGAENINCVLKCPQSRFLVQNVAVLNMELQGGQLSRVPLSPCHDATE